MAVQVAGWLGVGEGEVDAVMEKEGLNPEFESGRTQGLGLGAKFLPHSKVSIPPAQLLPKAAAAAAVAGVPEGSSVLLCSRVCASKTGCSEAAAKGNTCRKVILGSPPTLLPCSSPSRVLQAVALVAGVEQRLGSKLKRSSQAAAAGVRGHHALLAAQHGKAHAHDRRQQQQAEPSAAARGGQEEEGEDSEDEGRGAAFGKGGKGAGARKAAAFDRSQLLAVSSGGVGGKKRRRRSGGGHAAGSGG